MRDASSEITRLCESCWGRLADASKVEQRCYAEDLLRLLRWEQPIPFSPREGAASLSAVPYLLRAGGQTTVAVYFVMPGALEPPTTVVERGLDFCAATRTLMIEAHSLSVNYTLISDLYRSFLYDVRTDELLLYADEPRTFNAEFVPVLTKAAMERGSIEEIRRQPRSVVARRLREWRQRWSDCLATRGPLSEADADLALDRFTVIRYLFEHDILRRTKGRLEKRFAELTERASGADPQGCGEELVRLFHDMWLDWGMDLFKAKPELDRVLANDALTVPLLKECGLLSRGRFSIATILESFNYGEPAEKMRVRTVPDVNEERDLYLARQTLDTIDQARLEIDLMDEGYRAVFHWFDEVIASYERLEMEFDARSYVNKPAAQELDLFQWSEIDSKRPEACQDKIGHACKQGFGVYHNSARQYRVARLLLTLHLISRFDQTKHAIDRFPSLANALMKRPLVLPADRVMNVPPPLDPEEDDDLDA